MTVKVVDAKSKRTLENGKWIQHRKFCGWRRGMPPKRIRNIPEWPCLGFVCPNCGVAGNQDIYFATTTKKYNCKFCQTQTNPNGQRTQE